MEKEIENYLKENYLLIRKGRLYYFLGGTVAMIPALLGLTYHTGTRAVEHAISKQAVKEATAKIEEMKGQSEDHFKAIEGYLDQLKDLNSILKERCTMAKQFPFLQVPQICGMCSSFRIK